jgi:hypothetical protein
MPRRGRLSHFRSRIKAKNPHPRNTTPNVMATSTATVFRFLLPRITCSGKHVQYTALRSAVASKAHGFHSAASELPRRQPTHNQSLCSTPRRRIYPSSRIITEVAARRAFSATTPQLRDHHFDTLKFVQRLKDEGFTEEQAVAMMRVLSDVIEERYFPWCRFHPL